MQAVLCLHTPMVEASQHFWTGCAEGFSESPRQTAQGQETRLADPRCSTQDVCKKKKRESQEFTSTATVHPAHRSNNTVLSKTSRS